MPEEFPKQKTPAEALAEFRDMVTDLVSHDTTGTLQGMDVSQLTLKDYKYFQLFIRGGFDVARLDAWAASIPPEETSRLQFVRYVRQKETERLSKKDDKK